MIEYEANTSDSPLLRPSAPPTGVPVVATLRQSASAARREERSRRRGVAVRARRRLMQRDCISAEVRPTRQRRRSRTSLPSFERLSAALAEPLKHIVENIFGPLKEMLRQFAEKIDLGWLGAFRSGMQKLLHNPMLDVLRGIQERLAEAVSPFFGVLKQVGQKLAATMNPLMHSFRQMRDWASGFMSYGAKLRRLTDAMFSSWTWKLPNLSDIFKPAMESALKMFRSIEWPSFPDAEWLRSLTKTLTQAAVRLVFRAAVRVRNIILNEKDSEAAVRKFMLDVLDLFPKGEPHIEAAKEALLEDDWLRAEPDEVKAVLVKRIRDLHRNYRLIGTTELRHHHIVSLDAPSTRSIGDGGKLLTLGETLAEPVTVEDLVLGAEKFADDRIRRVFGRMKVQEARVAELWARDDGMTWATAAAEAGLSPEFGERVRRKLHRLGEEFSRRQTGGLRVPSQTGPKVQPAFC